MITKHHFLTSMAIVAAIATFMFVNWALEAGARATQLQIGYGASTLVAKPGAIFGTPLTSGNTGNGVRMAGSSSGKTKTGTSSGGTSQGGSKPPMRPGDYPTPSGSTATAATAGSGSPGPTGPTGPVDLPK
jgi:hypothetical protein